MFDCSHCSVQYRIPYLIPIVRAVILPRELRKFRIDIDPMTRDNNVNYFKYHHYDFALYKTPILLLLFKGNE